jgi:DHA1 family bicyclomycin/chloramphenicol resistance-like MFS transporter
VGQMFDGTIRPLLGGFALFGALTIVAVLWAERGRLFSHPGDDPQLAPGVGGH